MNVLVADLLELLHLLHLLESLVVGFLLLGVCFLLHLLLPLLFVHQRIQLMLVELPDHARVCFPHEL